MKLERSIFREIRCVGQISCLLRTYLHLGPGATDPKNRRITQQRRQTQRKGLGCCARIRLAMRIAKEERPVQTTW